VEGLETLTVKELKQKLKDSGLNQRGILSRLKLKQDLVDFLKENLEPSDINGEQQHQEDTVLEQHTPTNGLTTEQPAEPQTAAPPKKPMSMPSPSIVNGAASPKDAIFERVYLQYPPVRDGNCTGLGEFDVRQTYHPIFTESVKASSDMDVVFVGTASCTPGVTRGVSCTALRLNWQRRGFHGVPKGIPNIESNFSGGTWVFDAGECTQASCHHRFVNSRPLFGCG
jgi:hypothetical protein